MGHAVSNEELDRAIKRIDRYLLAFDDLGEVGFYNVRMMDFFGERTMNEHEQAQVTNPLTRDEEHDLLVKEIVELKGKLSQFHTDREYQIHMVKGLDTQIQSIERDRTSLKTELSQLRASFDLLRGNFKLAQERWQKEKTSLEMRDHNQARQIRQMTTLVEEQSRIIKGQTAKLELLQSHQPGPDESAWREKFKQSQERWENLEVHLEERISLRDQQLRGMATTIAKQSRIIKSQTARLEELQQSQQPQPFWVVATREAGGFLVMGPDKTTWFQSPVSLSKDPREGEANLGLCQRFCELLNKAWKEGKAN